MAFLKLAISVSMLFLGVAVGRDLAAAVLTKAATSTTTSATAGT